MAKRYTTICIPSREEDKPGNWFVMDTRKPPGDPSRMMPATSREQAKRDVRRLNAQASPDGKPDPLIFIANMEEVSPDDMRAVMIRDKAEGRCLMTAEAAEAVMHNARVEMFLALAKGMGLQVDDGEVPGGVKWHTITAPRRLLCRLVRDAANGRYGFREYQVQVFCDMLDDDAVEEAWEREADTRAVEFDIRDMVPAASQA